VDINVNIVVSALDMDAANPIPTTATRPTTAAVTQSPLHKDNGSSASHSDLSLPVEDIIDNKIYPDTTKDGKFFYQLKEKAEHIAQQTKRR
jgi:hypothetical protein